MNKLLFCILFTTLLLTCACPAPKEDYVIANTSTKELNVIYKVANCSTNPDWTDWLPRIESYEEFLEAKDWEKTMNPDEYSLTFENEEQTIDSNNSETIKNECKVAQYKILIPQNKALRISNGDFHTLYQINYLKLEGDKGIVIFDKNISVLDTSFKKYKPSFFKRTQNTISY